MRLDEVTIGDFKNLHDLHVNFDESSPYTVLVGENGAGKSNLIEALTLIFRNIDLDLAAAFSYDPGADNDIDHFRPKMGVREDPEHPGYYWLAFSWPNLRLSCQRANRPRRDEVRGETAGKSDHFPLVDPAMRAHGPGDDLTREVPALLDPTNPADPLLLSFKPNGEVDLSPEHQDDPVAQAKFKASRLYLHLNWAKFRDARVILYNRVERVVERGAREAPKDFLTAHVATESFRDAIRDLLLFMRPNEEYSAAARVYVESFRHVWWVRDIVLRMPA